MPSHQFVSGVLCLALVGASAACTIRDDSTRANQIEGLRVLAIGSTPADVVLGDTAEISALVYDEDERPVSYQWSWCLSRGGADDGFACNIDEADLQTAWQSLDTGVDMPGYDLGTGETASFEMVFEPEQAFALCQILTEGEPDSQIALFTCLSGLGLSIQLEVTAGSDTIVAIRDIPVLLAGDERNQNPVVGTEFTRTLRDNDELGPDDPFVAERIYDVVADVGIEQSETFLPPEKEGLPPPEPRGEALFLSWFVTTGSTHRKGSQRTSYFDEGTIENLIENSWDMPYELEDTEARLFLVLRDERDGTSWAEYRFDVVEAP
ncbi:MAG: hypothetical protein GY811_17680 [Myxococcales bacterium]|nr:hypothetical protein [Myxococcales bacterium]